MVVIWTLECNLNTGMLDITMRSSIAYAVAKTRTTDCGVEGTYFLLYEDVAGYCTGNGLTASVSFV